MVDEEARPKDRVLFTEKRTDLVAVVVAFDRKMEDHHWAGFHRELQQTYGANFPKFHRNKIDYRNEKECYSFLGFKSTQA